jgi:membrane-bound ClpP family serine protease
VKDRKGKNKAVVRTNVKSEDFDVKEVAVETMTPSFLIGVLASLTSPTFLR